MMKIYLTEAETFSDRVKSLGKFFNFNLWRTICCSSGVTATENWNVTSSKPTHYQWLLCPKSLCYIYNFSYKRTFIAQLTYVPLFMWCNLTTFLSWNNFWPLVSLWTWTNASWVNFLFLSVWTFCSLCYSSTLPPLTRNINMDHKKLISLLIYMFYSRWGGAGVNECIYLVRTSLETSLNASPVFRYPQNQLNFCPSGYSCYQTTHLVNTSLEYLGMRLNNHLCSSMKLHVIVLNWSGARLQKSQAVPTKNNRSCTNNSTTLTWPNQSACK